MENIPPPICFICKKNFDKEVDKLHYCICDTAVCSDCINSIKTSDKKWICPKCGKSNNIDESKLFREKI